MLEASEEVFPSIVIEDAPFPVVVQALAAQANLRLSLDPQWMEGKRAPDGAVAPWPAVSLNVTNVTASQALEQLLQANGLTLVVEPETRNATLVEVPPSSPVPSAAVTSTNQMPAGVDGEELIPVLPIGDMPLRDVITILAESARIDIMFDPRLLTGATNALSTNDLPAMKLYNKTYRQALQAVLNNHDLIMVPDPNTEIARIVRRPSEPPLVTTIFQLRYSNPTNMMALITGTFPTPTRNKVSADPRTSQLVLVTPEAEIHGITNLIAQLDTPTKQVLIEANLLETAKNPRTVKGIDWSGTLEAQNVIFGNGRTTGETITSIPGQTTTTTLPSGRTVTSTSKSSTQTELTTPLGFGGLGLDTVRGFNPSTAFLNADGVRAVLSFLNSDSDTEVVATPRQVVLDNQKATLAVTRAFPIFEITPGSAQTPPQARITYTNLGTILEVTPRIAANSNISLKVIPEVSNIDSKDRQIINGDINEANVYAIRRMETEVVIPSGNTLVMGGLISDTTTKSFTKVPILGDLPGIGMVFRRDSKSRNKANLLIFITPTIVQDADFQPTKTQFLQTKPVVKSDVETSAWESGKPYQWNKKSK
jgi:type II secretory pathway component GspD/PulD (secretin)